MAATESLKRAEENIAAALHELAHLALVVEGDNPHAAEQSAAIVALLARLGSISDAVADEILGAP